MKKRIIVLFIPILMASFNAGAQYVGPSFTLSETLPSDQTRSYLAADYINLKNNGPGNGGFHAKPDVGSQFSFNIDPMMEFPPHEGEWGGPPDNHGGGGVGALPGNLLISPTGAAVYSIPIEVPDGLNNLTPDLKFVYNSQAGDGIMGDGWSISGLSKISRVPYTYYYNGYTATVELNKDDQLMLDGNYLRKTETDTEYRTETETFSIIKQISSNVDDGFTVYKKNGLIYEYGTTDNSRYILQSGIPIAWYLTSIKDMNGNYINFFYKNDELEGSFIPDYIEYTGNEHARQLPFYKIEFGYKAYEREDTPKKYFTNPYNPALIYSRITRQLDKVSIIHIPTGSEIKYYKLTYEEGGVFSKKFLTGITGNFDYIYNKRGHRHLNKTKFEWFNSSYELSLDQTNAYLYLEDLDWTITQQSVFAANLDHEPTSDFIHLSKDNRNNSYQMSAFSNISQYSPINNNFLFSFSNMIITHDFGSDRIIHSITPGDFDGDGIDEVVSIYQYSPSGQTYLKIGSFDFENSGQYIEGNEFGGFNMHHDQAQTTKFYVSDFSGNGYDDLCIVNYNGSHWKFSFRLSDKDKPLEKIIESPTISYNHMKKILLGDFNGNAKTELLFIGNNFSKVISLTSDNTSFTAESASTDFSNIDDKNDIVAGDFNSDAKTDVLMLKAGAEDNWEFYFSYGKGKFAAGKVYTVEGIGAEEKFKFAVDVNGDHFNDLCLVHKIIKQDEETLQYYTEYYRKDFLISPQNNAVRIEIRELTNSEGEPIPVLRLKTYSERHEVNFCLGNFSGNTANQLIASRIYNMPNSLSLVAEVNLSAPIYHSFINCVNKITNGLGEVKKINYCPFTSVPSYYGKNVTDPERADLPFPLIYYTGILNVVTSYEQELEQDGFRSVNYYYDGPKYHKIGKGFLGFDVVWEENKILGTRTQRNFNVDNTWFHIVNDFVEVRQIEDLKKISVTKNEYGFRAMNDPAHLGYFLYLKSTYHEIYDLNANLVKRNKTEYGDDYDEWGNPKKIIRSFGNGATGWAIKESKSIDYINIIENERLIAGLVDNITTTFTRYGMPAITKDVDFEYYEATSGLVKSETIESDDPKSFTTNYEYDDYGNIILTTLSANEMEDRTIFFDYSDDGRFLKNLTNTEGHIETYAYYPETGLIKTLTDANDLTTTYRYDIFGKLSEETLPNGTSRQIVRRWSVPGSSTEHEDAPASAYYYEWAKTSGSAETLTFYDQFEKEVRTVNIGFDGTKIFADKEYYGNVNILTGLMSRSSNPYYLSDGPSWTNMDYDIFRRIKKIDRPDGSFEKSEYDGNTKTVVAFDGQTKVMEYNGAGWLTKITDNNDAVTEYIHRSDGLIEDIIINGQQASKLHIAYDAFGQKENFTDPDKGLTSYSYNPFGELESKTDANAITTSFEYDKLGRIKKRKSPGEIMEWQYDTQGFGVGKIHAAGYSTSDGYVDMVVQEYVYNELGYLITQRQSVNANPIEFNYTYDVYGRQKKKIFPSGYSVGNYFNNLGYLIYIKENDNKIIWEATGMNALGMYTKFRIGSNIDQEYKYDLENGMLTDIISGTSGLPGSLQNIHYGWKTDGNLEYRQDNNRSLKERFEYDTYNRLSKVFINDENLQLSTGYDKSGNIVNKSDAGTYVYDQNSQPHAVQKIIDKPETISHLFQNIKYTSFDKVELITEQEGLEVVYSLEIEYGTNRERVWQRFIDHKSNITIKKRYFNSIFESIDENGQEKSIHYLTGPTGLFGMVTINKEDIKSTNYILKDHLGSITHVLEEEGNILQEMNFDAWGRRRNPDSWDYENVPSEFIMDRGFTMHEHLEAFKLINMNGRMYDPVVGRFLSVDPFVQFPEYSQSYNRYSYVLNNPLKFTDPSGFRIGGDSLPDSQSNPGFNLGYLWLYQNIDPNGGDDEASSFSTDYVLGGKANTTIGVVNPDLNDESNSKLDNDSKAQTDVVGWLSGAYNSTIGRAVVPDFLAIGVGFYGIAGVGGGTRIEFRWVSHGPEASWKPMIAVTQSVGGGFSIDATLNLEVANYIGNVNNITRSMIQTSSPNGDFPTIWGAGGVAAGGKIGIIGYVTPNVGGSFITGRELNLGVGLPAGPLPANGAGGVSNTWILYDFLK